MKGRNALVAACAAAVVTAPLATGPSADARPAGTAISACAPGGSPVVLAGSADEDDAKTYRELPVDVGAGTTRIEVSYSWANVSPAPSTPLTDSTVDLALWDADGYRSVDGFRGWSGDRHGRTGAGQDPVFVQADVAERGYRPGPIEVGTWHVELGFGAVASGGITYEVTVACSSPSTGPAFVPDPVDPAHVADPDPGWYAGDFHMHGFHSHPEAPPWDDGDPGDVDSFVDFGRSAGLDFFPITDYVTTQHHRELGPVQRANPDVVLWPGREIITYFGHATVFGETPDVADYRHGFEGITLGDIQAATVADGALFGLAHPTSFPDPIFTSFCRGCYFNLLDDIDWGLVDTLEVLTGPILVDDSQGGGPGGPLQIQNPFVESAIDLWEERLLAGNRITAVSGSDDKKGPDLGSSATQVHAASLSRRDLVRAIQGGRAYVQTKGVGNSPTLDVVARGADGSTGGLGDTLPTDRATIDVTVGDADGQFLRVTRDGEIVDLVAIEGDDFTHRIDAESVAGSGPLGTFWRVDTLDAQSLTTISNPVFLQSSTRHDPGTGGPGADDVRVAPAVGSPSGVVVASTPATGGNTPSVWIVVVVVVALLVLRKLTGGS